nr:hypothetical protein [Tanacetum cinerariifolium]
NPDLSFQQGDTLEIAEITWKKMLEKMKGPLCVEKKVKFASPNYSKENYLATFSPQRHLTPEQIFWSLDIQEHFEGIQTALVKEVKEIKEIFEQMESKVEQNAVDKQCADIERKNLLIENENLIADCLSHELLYSVMNDVNIVSRFFEMHDAYIVKQARCLELKDEISKLKHKIQKDDHSEMIKCFSNLEIKGKMQCVTMDTVKPKVTSPCMYVIDVESIPPRNRNNREVHLDYLKHLKESVETLREIVKEAKIETPLDNALVNACFYTKRYRELLEYVIGTYPKELSKRDKKVAPTPLNRKKASDF